MEILKPSAPKKVAQRQLPGSQLIAKLARDRERGRAREIAKDLEDTFEDMSIDEQPIARRARRSIERTYR